MTLTPSFWFSGDAEEALRFYAETLPDFSHHIEHRLTAAQSELLSAPAGTPLLHHFRLLGMKGRAMIIEELRGS